MSATGDIETETGDQGFTKNNTTSPPNAMLASLTVAYCILGASLSTCRAFLHGYSPSRRIRDGRTSWWTLSAEINSDDELVNGTSDDDVPPLSTSVQPGFDVDEKYNGDLFSLCFLSDDEGDSCDAPSSFTEYPSDRDGDTLSNLALRYIPVMMPILAYSTYEITATIFDGVVDFISNNNWVAVDGGAYQSSIITPAINGLVVPSMALLFATLMSNTINTLRQRQMQIRTSLNIEANDLRMLSGMCMQQ